MTDKLQVGVVCPYDLSAPGGVQQLVTGLAERLGERGHEAVLIGAGEGPAGRDAVGVGRSIRWRANESAVPLTLSPLSWDRVRFALADVDVVHVHEPMIPVVGWAAASLPKPMVMTFHADPPPWVPYLYRWVPGLASKMRRSVLTAVSETAARPLPASWGEPVMIPNAIDVASYQAPVDRVPGRVAFLGRDEPRKGLDHLLRAWPRIRATHPEASLVVMGASREQAPEGVEFLGSVGDAEKRRLLGSSGIFVAPNTGGESFGIVLAEAMAAGCAVVASDLPAFRPVMGAQGRLVPAGDSNALAISIGDLLDDPDMTARLGSMAREAAERFDWPVVVDRYLAAYRQAMSGGNADRRGTI